MSRTLCFYYDARYLSAFDSRALAFPIRFISKRRLPLSDPTSPSSRSSQSVSPRSISFPFYYTMFKKWAVSLDLNINSPKHFFTFSLWIFLLSFELGIVMSIYVSVDMEWALFLLAPWMCVILGLHSPTSEFNCFLCWGLFQMPLLVVLRGFGGSLLAYHLNM